MSERPTTHELPGHASAGFTLIELVISLGLFALIAVAGIAMVDGILGVQRRTEARLDRMAQVNRAMFAVASDLDQVTNGPIAGDAAAVSFMRVAPGQGGPPLPIRYQSAAGGLFRVVAGRPQLVLPGIAAARWRYLDQDWRTAWPPDPDSAERWPRAIEMEVTLAPGSGPQGLLRRIVALPARPRVGGEQ
ncbi:MULTISPECIES: type II secretion system protein GspJ [unclassified Sphingomonas]|uniref:type II secretion system protein GspJ n=1 Tax=unclassified Sphingomonas TaxID=196159 RepID=UPI00082D1A30|nr:MULTISPECIES: type II secretion system protein GspJ [unclassified Sphingomonas]